MALSLDKIEQKAPALLSLAKKALFALETSSLHGQKSKVALCLDFSGSMGAEYRSGNMQRLAEKILALGTQLDDDGAIDLFIFDSGAAYLGEVTIDNYQDAVDRMTAGRRMGTTNYAAAFTLIEKHYGYAGLGARAEKPSAGRFGGLFGKKTAVIPASPLAQPADAPVFVIFLTDGVPNNQADAIRTITDASYSPIFWQFLSIGTAQIPFLHRLDELDGRLIDNASYQPVGNVDKVTDEKLFSIILEEYPDWVVEQTKRRQIK